MDAARHHAALKICTLNERTPNAAVRRATLAEFEKASSAGWMATEFGIRRPGEAGVSVVHGQAYSSTKRTIYLSPSVEYAAFPVYAQFFPFDEQQEHWGQLVLQCRSAPLTCPTRLRW